MNKQDLKYQEIQKLKKSKPDNVKLFDVVIEHAANPESVFHDWFTWDAAEGLLKWQQREFRGLMQSFRTIEDYTDIDLNETVVVEHRSFVFIPSLDDYESVEVVYRDEDLRAEYEAEVLKELTASKRKYTALLKLKKKDWLDIAEQAWDGKPELVG